MVRNLICFKMCHSYGVQKQMVDYTLFYRYVMPNGICVLKNAIRHDISVAYH